MLPWATCLLASGGLCGVRRFKVGIEKRTKDKVVTEYQVHSTTLVQQRAVLSFFLSFFLSFQRAVGWFSYEWCVKSTRLFVSPALGGATIKLSTPGDVGWWTGQLLQSGCWLWWWRWLSASGILLQHRPSLKKQKHTHTCPAARLLQAINYLYLSSVYIWNCCGWIGTADFADVQCERVLTTRRWLDSSFLPSVVVVVVGPAKIDDAAERMNAPAHDTRTIKAKSMDGWAAPSDEWGTAAEVVAELCSLRRPTDRALHKSFSFLFSLFSFLFFSFLKETVTGEPKKKKKKKRRRSGSVSMRTPLLFVDKWATVER